ncbi:hypothetical protein BaRGS_00007947, partial [Batillaria attramentaria]
MAALQDSGKLEAWYQYFQQCASWGMTYDSKQGKWQKVSNTAMQGQNQTGQSMMQNQAAYQGQDYYSGANSGNLYSYYQNAGTYGQPEYTSAYGSNSGVATATNPSNTNSAATGNFGNGAGGNAWATAFANMTQTFGNSTTGQNFGNSAGQNSSNSTAGQIFGNAFGQSAGNSTAGSSFGNTFGHNVANSTAGQGFGNAFGQNTASSSTGQNFGNSNTAQAFGNNTGQNFGSGAGGGMLGNMAGNLGGLMSLLGSNLFQNNAAFGGNCAIDGEGGYYAAPVDSAFQTFDGMTMGGQGKKWSGKDGKQNFYGGRFAGTDLSFSGQMAAMQGGKGKTKHMMPGVRVNATNERVVDVECPLNLFSKWRQLHKSFFKQDTEVIRHLFEIHDTYCEDCQERLGQKKQFKGKKGWEQPLKKESEQEAEEDVEMTEEELEMQRLMGFSNFNTTKEAMAKGKLLETQSAVNLNSADTKEKNKNTEVEGNGVDTEASSTKTTEGTEAPSEQTATTSAQLIGTVPTETDKSVAEPSLWPKAKPSGLYADSQTDGAASATPAETDSALVSEGGTSGEQDGNSNDGQQEEPKPEEEKGSALTDEERLVMQKLGWSVFNKKHSRFSQQQLAGEPSYGRVTQQTVLESGKSRLDWRTKPAERYTQTFGGMPDRFTSFTNPDSTRLFFPAENRYCCEKGVQEACGKVIIHLALGPRHVACQHNNCVHMQSASGFRQNKPPLRTIRVK